MRNGWQKEMLLETGNRNMELWPLALEFRASLYDLYLQLIESWGEVE